MSSEGTSPTASPLPTEAPLEPLKEEEVIPTLTLAVKKRPVWLEQGGLKTKYFIRELIGEQREQWMNCMNKRIRQKDDGSTGGFKTFKGMHADLLAMSMTDEKGALLNPRVFDSWPASTLHVLYKMALEISSLDAEAEARAKKASEESENDSSGSD